MSRSVIEGHRLTWALPVILVVGIVSAALYSNDPFFSLVSGCAVASMTTVAAVLMTRAPGNRVGSLLMAAGVFLTASVALGDYAVAANGLDGVAGAVVPLASLFNNVVSLYPLVILLIGIPLIFPDGHLLGPRWRFVVVLTVAAMVALTINKLFMPGLVGSADVENPLGIAGAESTLQLFGTFSNVTAPIGFGAAAAAVAIRFRRRRGIEREQLKWFLAVVAVCAIAFLVAIQQETGPIADAAFIIAFCGLVAMPIAIGVAILRYRLYEIDRLVSRTIAYALVTGGLLAVYLVVNLGLTTVFSSLASGNSVAVAASTLVVAALFTPVRRRVQRVVDRRFDRARYDGERTSAAFSERLRNEVDLAAVTSDLDRTVRSAIAPTSVAVWLRAGEP